MVEGPYVGRFAPSPSGALHLGSVVAALASFLQARAHGGEWLVRIDDIDPPRTRAGAADAILRSLERLGLEWSRSVTFQSHARAQHLSACQWLLDRELAFRCICSRRQLVNQHYAGTCRARHILATVRHAVRAIGASAEFEFTDAVQGRYSPPSGTAADAFVIWRAEDLPAYHLATVVDDAAAGVTEVVRGADLLESTPRQLHLQKLLALSSPRYAHLPLVLDPNGLKLSKQRAAEPIDVAAPAHTLARALSFLRHPLPPTLCAAPSPEIIAWAANAWRLEKIPRARGLTEIGFGGHQRGA
ncbi:MAG: tRNA glutamyl-Q(34) synthetase GluQRS [Gammaproteobacteria bacterium]|nr:tRNA glutamyl-Q(34) synthetase GluQRS [Gammaproteobacteria bacterium]